MDIDIWVNPTQENAKKVYNALAKFGAPLKQVEFRDFHSMDTIFQIGLPPRRIDIITAISGVTFSEAYPSTTTSETDGVRIKYLSIKHLIQNKLAAGREKDHADVKMLKKLLAD